MSKTSLRPAEAFVFSEVASMDGPREAAGELWFTVEQAAQFLGRTTWAIYQWKNRGLLTSQVVDENGRQIYPQRELAAAERQVRDRARPKRTRAA